ncbi:peptidoglycan-binding domain-containing protein [Streptomyces sp. NPDC006879]|uniref:peptidoglycan-binding domain-containing protein n=1 Tax=Streptomyces sp. NPDC006879 TaxID=3364767 RepID=UPI00367B67B1
MTELQLRLAAFGMYDGEVSGTYSRQVERAVKRFQRSTGITEDRSGVYGTKTRETLETVTWEP